MKQYLFLATLLFGAWTQASTKAIFSGSERVYACTEDRNLWQYQVDIYERTDAEGHFTGEFYAILAEENVFRRSRRVLRPYIEITSVVFGDKVSSADVYNGEDFQLGVYLGIRERNGFYSEFVGKSHRGNPLNLKMFCVPQN